MIPMMRTMPSCSNCGTQMDAGVRFCPHCGTQVMEADAPEGLLGRTLGEKYRLLSELGAGSMGKVYLAEHLSLKKKVAIKVLHNDLLVTEDSLQRFQREGIAAGQFSHPNAIQIFDFDRADDLYFLAMEYVEGETLSDHIRETGPMSPFVAIDVVRQILAALSEAHRCGIIHRDLKPENIMVLEAEDGTLTVKVLDFGLSKLVDRPLGASLVTQIGRVMGTPLYMAPEQAGGEEVDHRSDLYAVGLVLYELLTGRPPFQGTSITELLIKQATEPPPSIFDTNPKLGVPQDLEDVIRKALEKLRENRFQSARDMMTALAAVDLSQPAAPPSAVAEPETPGAGDAPAARRPRSVKGLLAVVVAAVVVVVLFQTATQLTGESVAFARVRLKDVESRSAIEATYLGQLDQARQKLELGDHVAAATLVESAKLMACADAEVFHVGGLAAQAAGDVDMAVIGLEEALSRDPDYAEPAIELGWIHFERGELDEARERFEGELASAVAGRGALALRAGELEPALGLLTRATELDGTNARALLWFGRAHVENGDLDAARDMLVRAKTNGSMTWETFAELGDVYLRLDRLEDAERELSQAVKLNPRAVDALADLAAVHLGSGRAGEAVTLLEGKIESNPRGARASLVLGAALEEVGRGDEAIATLERGLAASSVEAGDAEAGPVARGHALLGVLLQEAGRTREATESYRAAIALDAGLAVPHLNLGLLEFEEERFEEARDALERAVALDESLAFAHYALGLLYMDYLGDASTAADHLESYRDLGGEDRRVGGWLERLGRR